MSVISIQSQVVYGHVGNSAAIYPMIANGVEVYAVPTTLLSNTPHYPTLRGHILPSDFLADLLLGVEERGLVEAARVVVTGYLGSTENAEVVHDFILRAKKKNPRLSYICDPVIGDSDLGVFVASGLPGYFRENLTPLADLITPNAFEFEFLAGLSGHSAEDIASALAQDAGRFGKSAVVTGALPASAPGSIDTLFSAGGDVWRVRTPKVNVRPNGTGDLFTGALAAALAGGKTLSDAVEQAVSGVYDILSSMLEGQPGEMPLAAQSGALRWQQRAYRAERV